MPQQEQWQVSGNAAELYEQYSVRYFIGPWAPGLVALAALQPGERVLDLACGTGVVARLAASKVGPTGRVTGLDLNAFGTASWRRFDCRRARGVIVEATGGASRRMGAFGGGFCCCEHVVGGGALGR